MNLDFSIQSPEQRQKLVQKIIAETPQKDLTPRYLEILADYIIFAMDKSQKKEKTILTQNRLVTINKRETSFQGLVDKLENGEDGIYNMMASNGKNALLSPKIGISAEQAQKIPGLKELRETIKKAESAQKTATGKKKFLLKKQIIQMRQQQYMLKNSYNPPTYSTHAVKQQHKIQIDQHVTVQNGEIIDKSILSLFNPKHISAILCNYNKLKNAAESDFNAQSYFLIEQIDALISSTLRGQHEMLYDILQLKIAGSQNLEIQQFIRDKYHQQHSIQYISTVWRNKIPKLLADKHQQDYLIWYYTTQQYGKWKRCSRCGEVKLAHNKFFSKNKTSKDGWYSICKACRNAKSKENK